MTAPRIEIQEGGEKREREREGGSVKPPLGALAACRDDSYLANVRRGHLLSFGFGYSDRPPPPLLQPQVDRAVPAPLHSPSPGRLSWVGWGDRSAGEGKEYHDRLPARGQEQD